MFAPASNRVLSVCGQVKPKSLAISLLLLQEPAIDGLDAKAPVAANTERRNLVLLEEPINRARMNLQIGRDLAQRHHSGQLRVLRPFRVKLHFAPHLARQTCAPASARSHLILFRGGFRNKFDADGGRERPRAIIPLGRDSRKD